MGLLVVQLSQPLPLQAQQPAPVSTPASDPIHVFDVTDKIHRETVIKLGSTEASLTELRKDHADWQIKRRVTLGSIPEGGKCSVQYQGIQSNSKEILLAPIIWKDGIWPQSTEPEILSALGQDPVEVCKELETQQMCWVADATGAMSRSCDWIGALLGLAGKWLISGVGSSLRVEGSVGNEKLEGVLQIPDSPSGLPVRLALKVVRRENSDVQLSGQGSSKVVTESTIIVDLYRLIEPR
jgi:hypothetical protein